MPALDGQLIALSVFSVIALGAALMVVNLRNIVHCAYFLALTLISTAAIYIILSADFVGIAQILIYGGAVTVLLVFAIMLTRLPGDEEAVYNTWRPFAAFLAAGISIMLVTLVYKTPWGLGQPAAKGMDLQLFSEMLFGKYLVPFEAISLVLLAAMVGAIYLAKKGDED